MKKLYFLILLMNSVLGHAQVDTAHNGLKFENELTWSQIKEKALSEHKYIFVDCFATWCGPCRRMDMETYVNVRLGEYMNSKFISLKLQMDTTGKDDEQVEKWYSVAHQFCGDYTVIVLPSFLFFSPEGRIVHKDFGFKSVDDFTILVKEALNPDKQYYTLRQNYRTRQISYSDMPYLAETAKSLHEKELADSVAQYYSINYLLRLKDDDLYTKKNIEFLRSFLQHSSDRGFALFYHHPQKIDEMMGARNYAEKVVEYIITKEKVYPKLMKGGKLAPGKPNWNQIRLDIASEYGKYYAERIVLNAQIYWYSNKKDWQKAVKYNVLKVDRYGLDTAGFGKYALSDMIYSVIFMHGIDKGAIKKSEKWMHIILKSLPNDAPCMDTYANLLYKLGKKVEALQWEEKASLLNSVNPEIQENYLKMKKGEPTWSTN